MSKMKKRKKHLVQDLLIIIASIFVAIFFAKTGLATKFVLSLSGQSWLGAIFAGIFFTSIFTVAPSVVLFRELALFLPLPLLAILGGLGAVLGDYIIFLFARDRMAKDFAYLTSYSKKHKFFLIFKTKLFNFLFPLIGALIVASPLPDEVGVAMMGLSKMKLRYFFIISFILNGLGIFLIGWLTIMAL